MALPVGSPSPVCPPDQGAVTERPAGMSAGPIRAREPADRVERSGTGTLGPVQRPGWVSLCVEPLRGRDALAVVGACVLGCPASRWSTGAEPNSPPSAKILASSWPECDPATVPLARSRRAVGWTVPPARLGRHGLGDRSPFMRTPALGVTRNRVRHVQSVKVSHKPVTAGGPDAKGQTLVW